MNEQTEQAAAPSGAAAANKANGDAVLRLRLHERDVGSAPVQVARLSARIRHLTGHLAKHPKDKHTRRGLLAMVNRRRKHLLYLKRNEPAVYAGVIGALGLRK